MSEVSDTMTVTVRDNAAEAAAWGHGRGGPVIRKVTISAFCPRCGQRRGEPRGLNSCDDGDYFWVQIWDNPCGHVDMYEDVITEARALASKSSEAERPTTEPFGRDYVCPQCGPDPRGMDVHSDERHTWPPVLHDPQDRTGEG